MLRSNHVMHWETSPHHVFFTEHYFCCIPHKWVDKPKLINNTTMVWLSSLSLWYTFKPGVHHSSPQSFCTSGYSWNKVEWLHPPKIYFPLFISSATGPRNSSLQCAHATLVISLYSFSHSLSPSLSLFHSDVLSSCCCCRHSRSLVQLLCRGAQFLKSPSSSSATCIKNTSAG
jgi:hypothetical protein